jgi:curved DNA-binding protein CbpA
MRARRRYHEALGVPRDATPAEVKRAYRALVRELHPDRMRDPDLARNAENRLKEINAAWSDFLASRRRASTEAEVERDRSDRASEVEPEDPGDPLASARRRERVSRDRQRAERARWLHEREARERRARERAEALRREREAENFERRLHQHEQSLNLLRFALAALAVFVVLCVLLVLSLALA